MSKPQVMETVISIGGVMSDSLKRSVDDVKRQLGLVDKATIETAKKYAALASAAAGAAGAMAAAFVKKGSDLTRTFNGIAAQTGATGKELEEFKNIAAEVYESGKGENLQEVADALVNIRQASGLAGEELKAAANASMLLKDSFGMEAEETTRAATSLMKNFGISAEEAYGIIAHGAQNGANKNGDLLDTLNEYSVHYKALGFSSEEFVQTLIKGAESGAFSIDKVGDAIKEFTIRSKDGSKASTEAFEALGLNAETMTAQFAAGGSAAQAAFKQVVDALNSMKDPVQKNALGVALFGTQFEDLEAGVLKNFASIDASAIDSEKTLRELEKIKYADLGYAISQVGRKFETSLIPAAEKAGQAVFERMPEIEKAIAGVQPHIVALADAFVENLPAIMDAIGSAAQTAAGFAKMIVENWSWIGPTIAYAAGAFALFKFGAFTVNLWKATAAVIANTKAAWANTAAQRANLKVALKANLIAVKDAAIWTGRALAIGASAIAQVAAMTATAAWSAAAVLAQGVTIMLSAATWALGAAFTFLASPIGLVVLAIGAAIAAGVWLYKNWDTVKSKAAELGAAMAQKWQEIKASIMAPITAVGDWLSTKWAEILNGASALGDNIKGIFKSAFEAIPSLLKAPINGAIWLINSAIGAINGIGFTVPDWVPGIGGKAFSVNIPEIPMLATGGFTNGPSIAGEAGQEAVISFDPAYRSENIGYLLKAAERLGMERPPAQETVGYYAERLSRIGNGEALTSTSSYATTYNLGGVTFAPQITVAGGPKDKAEDILEQLRDRYGEFIDMIEEALQEREAAKYGASGVF